MTQTDSTDSGQAVLYVLPTGDGFTYPSMSAESLACIAFFKLLPKNPLKLVIKEEWEAKESPNGRLPYFKCACGISSTTILMWQHLHHCKEMEDCNVDSWMTKDERADTIASCMATLNAGDTIVDLYLYVTYANYVATTRHAYTTYLPLYANYIIPPAHRKAAIARTESYGVDFLQSDLEEPQSISTQSGGISTIPATSNASLFGFTKQQLTLAGRRMRLNSILSRAISALEYAQDGLDRNGGNWTTNTNKTSFLDAIIIGYLGLILSTKVPDQWAAEIIREKVPRLASWAELKAQSIFQDLDIQVRAP